MGDLLCRLIQFEKDINLAEVNPDLLNEAAVEHLFLFSPGPNLLAPVTPAPAVAQDILEIAMAQAEQVPMQAAPALVQLATVAGAATPELAAQALEQLTPKPTQAVPPSLAALAPAAPALAAPAMVARAPAPELAAAAQAAGPDAAATAAPGDPAVVDVFEAGIVEVPQIDERVDFLPAHTVILARDGDQPLLFKRWVHPRIIHPSW